MDRDRRSAFLILKSIEVDKTWSNLAVARQFSEEKPKSPAFVRGIVYGVLRNQNLLDFNIERFLKKSKLKVNEKLLLRMGFYQLGFMDVKAYAAINETVLLAKKLMPGREGFINAVLRAFQKQESKIIYSDDTDVLNKYSVNYSCSQSIAGIIISSYGEEKAGEILSNLCKKAPLSIRANTLKLKKEELKDRLLSLGFELRDGLGENCFYVEGSGLLDTDLYKDGYFSVQGDASQLSIDILSPKKGENIVDLCAAPGGKSCYCAEKMGNEGTILAYDIYPHRVALIEKEARRLGINIIKAKTADSTQDLGLLCDAAICDVPCSGLGTLRRNPELKLKEISLNDLIQIQQKILVNAAYYAKDRILYSTCTINPAENEEQIKRFLSENSSWKLDTEKKILPVDNGPDGFYIALLIKK